MKLPAPTRRFIDWTVIAVAALDIILLGIIVGYLISNSRAIAERATIQLKTSRAVVRCTLSEELTVLERITRQLGLTNLADDIVYPNTEGIDCDEVLNRPIGGI